jgi:hypothetical protein
MLPRSDDIEALFGRVKTLSADLGRLRGAEVTQAGVKSRVADLAREWLRVSPAIRDASFCKPDTLERYDRCMSELLASSTTRPRASALKKKLAVFLDGALDDIVIPLIQVEGSPRQVAARQIQEILAPALDAEEAAYVEEAARCLTVQAFRAAMIMLWCAAVARMHAAVVQRGFAAYNAAVDSAIARSGSPFNRIKQGAKLSSLAELQRSRDADLIIIGIDLFAYDLQIYQELDRLLGTRNDAAHPGMGQPGALDVQQFASKLRRFVFDRIAR